MSEETLNSNNGEQSAELLGPEDHGWYGTYVLDWIGLCADLTDSDVRGYLILRSLIFDAKGRRRNPVRVFTLAELCKLIPGPKDKPSSLTRIRDLLRRLSFVGLVSTPDGKPLKTSSRGAAQGKQIRMRINDRPINGYVPQWRNTEDKLDEIRPEAERAAAEAAERDIARQAAKRSEDEAGRNSDPVGRNSDPVGRNSDPGSGSDLGERGLVFSAYSSSLLSGAGEAADRTVTAAEAEVVTEEREAATPEDDARPVQEDQAPAVVPSQREADAVEDRDQDVAAVVAAYRAAYGAATPPDETLAGIAADAAALLSGDWPVEHVVRLAGELPARGYTSLARHAGYNPPAPAPASPKPRCVNHPGRVAEYSDLCVECHGSKQAAAGPRMSAGDLAVGAAFRQRLRNRARVGA